MATIEITGIGSEMQGVGRLSDGRAAFVAGTLPGERVAARIVKDAGRYCEAELVEILEPSAHRIAPACAYSGTCGGCRIRHADYAHTLELKGRRVSDAMARIAGMGDAVVRGTVGCENPERARNKAEYAVRDGRVGMIAAGGSGFVEIDDCLLQSEASVRTMRFAASLLRGTGIDGWFVTRTNAAGEVMAILSAQGGAPGWLDRLPEAADVKSVYFCALKPRPTHALDGKMTHIAGARTIFESLCGLRFELSPQTFFQVNVRQAEVLYSLALDAAALDGTCNLLDAYCGCGTITLAAARRAGRALGVEIVAPAIEDARKNAETNGLADKARFICADAGAEIPRLVRAGERFDSVILDPPRKGCDPALIDALGILKPTRVLYVSCDPATLARDVKLLSARGFRLEWVTPVDMFPWTGHVETVALMSKMH